LLAAVLISLLVRSTGTDVLEGGYSVGGIYLRGGRGLAPFALPGCSHFLPCDTGTSPSRRWCCDAKFDGEAAYFNMPSNEFSGVGFSGLRVGPYLCNDCQFAVDCAVDFE
jgi:hypothetical protein